MKAWESLTFTVMTNPENWIDCSFPSLTLKYRCFNDAEMFHQNLSLFKVDVWQLSRGNFEGNLLEITSNKVQIDRHIYDSLLKLNGMPTAKWAFGIPIRPLCLLFDNKYQLENNYILIAPPYSEFKMIQKSAYHLYIINMTEEVISDICQQQHLPELSQVLGNAYHHPSALICSDEQLAFLCQLITHFYQSLWSISTLNKQNLFSSLNLYHFLQFLEFEIPKQLILMITKSHNIQPKKVFLKRTSVLQKAEDYIMSYLKADISCQDICKAVGVSQRTLEGSSANMG